MANKIKLRGTTEKVFELGNVNKQIFDASAFTANHTWILPNSDGTPGYVLSTDGSGNLSWIAVGASADQTTPYYIPVGDTFTNNLNKQNLWHADIGVDGTLVVNGMLLEV